MRAFLNQPVEPQTGVIECMIRRKKGVMNTVYQAYYEVRPYGVPEALFLGRRNRFCRRRTFGSGPDEGNFLTGILFLFSLLGTGNAMRACSEQNTPSP